MALDRLTERIWYFPYEEERDRPNLGYIRGDRWSLAVDAGHSDAHVADFCRALREAGLPLPKLTVLTHWHWDHTFGAHAVSGLCLSNTRTDKHLREQREKLLREGPEAFLNIHPSVRREYAGGRPFTIVPADITFADEVGLDAGGCPVRVFRAEAPHTDDSTLVYVPDEKVLFVGDAGGDVFGTGEWDPAAREALARAVNETGADTVLEGHWIPTPRQEYTDYLIRGEN